MPETLNYELAPRPGMTATQRKAELDQARFVAVRNLAYMIYRRADNQPLMTYQETLDDRERVKHIIIQHEIAAGYLVNDLGAPGVAASPPAPPAPAQMQAPAPMVAAAPQVPQPMLAAPQNGAYPVPQMAAPGVPAQPQVAAAQPTQEQPTGRRRRTAAGGPPPAPAVAGPVPSPAVPGVAPTPTGGQMAFPAGAPVPAAAVPAPQQSFPTPAAPSIPAPAAPVATHEHAPMATVDLTPVITRIDSVGQQTDLIEKRLIDMERRLVEVNALALQSLAALHHFYATNDKTSPHLAADRVATLNDFRSFLAKFSGNPS